MGDPKRLDSVAVARDRLARGELDHLERVRQPADHHGECPEKRERAAWAVHPDGELATAQGEGLQHSGQAEHVVCVEVRQEDVFEVDQPGVRAQKLPLCPLAAVDEQAVSAPTQQRCGRAARGRGRRGGRPEEEEVEVHGRGS